MNSPFLRRVLTVDAVVSGAAGVVMLLGAGVLAPVLELPAGLLHGAGASLFPWFAALIWIARRPSLPRGGVQAVIVGNVAWVLGSIAVLFALQPNLLGYGFVIAQAVMVGLFAELQVVGLKREARAA